MAYGNVYVFNIYSVGVTTISINNMPSAGTIGAPAKSSTPPYSPPQLVIARTNLLPGQLDSSLFCVGDNTVTVNYGGQNWTGTVTIPKPPAPPLQRDLWLYLAFEQMFLFDSADGSIIPQPGGAQLQAVRGGPAEERGRRRREGVGPVLGRRLLEGRLLEGRLLEGRGVQGRCQIRRQGWRGQEGRSLSSSRGRSHSAHSRAGAARGPRARFPFVGGSPARK